MRTHAALLAVLLYTVALKPTSGKRKQPAPPLVVVQALKPTGIRISVLDEEGMDLVIINANINVPLEPKETGKITRNIGSSRDGFWTLEDSSQELKPNDVVFYVIYASSGQGRRNSQGHQIISELVDPSCKLSPTTINGRPACKGDLVFEDKFDTFNKTAWKHKVEFVNNIFGAFVGDEENSFTKDGVLHMKATVLADENQLLQSQKLEGCTSTKGGEHCERKPFAWQILPPTRTVWLTSASSFRFGRVEIRAKPAAGDWLFSEIILYPRAPEYSSWENGEMKMMMIRGNADLVNSRGEYYGAKKNNIHTKMGTCRLVFIDYWNKKLEHGLYTDAFHTYAMTWTPREVKFELDGEVFKTVAPPLPDGFLGTDQYRDCENSPWERGTFMAPLDKEFNFNLILNVAGFNYFSDGSKSGEYVKPWREKTPRAPLDFWRARDKWLPTWKGDFEIDYIKVWAL